MTRPFSGWPPSRTDCWFTASTRTGLCSKSWVSRQCWSFGRAGLRRPRYLTLTRLGGDGVTLRGAGGGAGIRVDPAQARSLWSKVAYIPWKDFLDYPGVIPHNAPRESIIALKMLLQDIGFADIEVTPYYDEKTREAVRTVQEKHDIRVDGIVGPITKMILYKEKKTLNLPSIRG